MNIKYTACIVVSFIILTDILLPKKKISLGPKFNLGLNLNQQIFIDKLVVDSSVELENFNTFIDENFRFGLYNNFGGSGADSFIELNYNMKGNRNLFNMTSVHYGLSWRFYGSNTTHAFIKIASDYIIDLNVYGQEIDLRSDYSYFFTLGFGLIFDNKIILGFEEHNIKLRNYNPQYLGFSDKFLLKAKIQSIHLSYLFP
tara:strand:- start:178 stop:777 length:600 start_codon:yes stop_codon:yes gene_type:complete